MTDTRNYVARKITIPANSYEETDITGIYLTILTATGDFKIGFGREAPEDIWPGIQIKTQGFDLLRFRNDTNAPVVVTFAATQEGLRDGRLQFSGTVQSEITNWPATEVVTEKDRAGVVNVTGNFTVYYQGGGVRELVNPAVNINGVMVNYAYICGSPKGSIHTGTTPPEHYYDYGKQMICFVEGNRTMKFENIYLPAGYGLWGTGNGNTLSGCDFKVL